MVHLSGEATFKALDTPELCAQVLKVVDDDSLRTCRKVCTFWRTTLGYDTPETKFQQRMWHKGCEDDGAMHYEVNPKLPRSVKVLEQHTEQGGEECHIAGTFMLHAHSEYPEEPGDSESLLLTQPPISSFRMDMGCGRLDSCDCGDKNSLCRGIDVECGKLTVHKLLKYGKSCMEDHRNHCDKVDGLFDGENQALCFTLTCDERRQWFLKFHHDRGHLSAVLAGGEKEVKALKRKLNNLEAINRDLEETTREATRGKHWWKEEVKRLKRDAEESCLDSEQPAACAKRLKELEVLRMVEDSTRP
ncbi:hypothetical protein LTR17_019190 [Elasticomyces elasticus]|nr:hypothetical protein LTR17_019190 [Elasticomyces elasticus]